MQAITASQTFAAPKVATRNLTARRSTRALAPRCVTRATRPVRSIPRLGPRGARDEAPATARADLDPGRRVRHACDRRYANEAFRSALASPRSTRPRVLLTAAGPSSASASHLFCLKFPTPAFFVSSRPVAPKRGVSLVVQAKETIDRTTGFIGKDNSGSGNIFAIEPRQLYTESPTSDKYAKVGLGGIPGVILALGIVAGVYFATQTLGAFEEGNQEFVNYQGQSLSYYIDLFSQ